MLGARGQLLYTGLGSGAAVGLYEPLISIVSLREVPVTSQMLSTAMLMALVTSQMSTYISSYGYKMLLRWHHFCSELKTQDAFLVPRWHFVLR